VRTVGPFGQGEEDGVNLFVEDFAVEEENGAEGLILGGGGDVPFHGQMGQEGLDFGGAHLGGVALVVEEEEAAHPVQVGLFGAVEIMLEPEDFPELVQQFLRHSELLVKGGGGMARFLLFRWTVARYRLLRCNRQPNPMLANDKEVKP
jgi:hypothetical protein